MNSNSDQVSKRLRTETNTKDEITINATHDLAGPSSGEATVVVTSEDIFDSAVNPFTADILPEIFQNTEILNAEDLLNFRLVNRCWRDAATPVLLKQNMCQIELDFNKVIIGHDGVAVAQTEDMHIEDFENDPSSYNFFHAYHPKNCLSDLSSLLSSSQKFPSTSIYFHPECYSAFRNLCPTSDCVNAHEYQINLLNFLSLHGKKFKKLSLCSGISKKAVQNLLYVHMPNLKSLALNGLNKFSVQDETWEGRQIPLCLPPPSVLAIREMSVPFQSCKYPDPDRKFDFVKELISVSPNLSGIQSVHTATLGYLLEIGKFQLIKELHVELTVHQMSTRDQLSKFLAATILNSSVSHLKLSRLTIGWLDHGKYKDNCKLVVKVLNIILSACKNYLQYLRIYMNHSDFLINLFIPPLPHLKCLGLHDFEIFSSPINTKIHFCGDVIGGALEAGGITADKSISDLNRLTFQRQNNNINIPADYFPRLQQVDLHMQKMKRNTDKLINFFAPGHPRLKPVPREGTIFPGDILSTVTKLELNTFFGPLYESQMSQLFPNVLHLKISCGYSISLSNWFWTAFPKLETLKISGLSGEDPDTKVIDSFFTGIPRKLCSKFGSDATCKVNPWLIFKRTMPYIGDCRNLNEFKINFGQKLNSQFASKITAVHGFEEVIHRTKIIFVFSADHWSVEEKEETRRHLDAVSAFVEIQMES